MQRDELSFLSGPNAEFIADLYARYVTDPGSVDPSWRDFFAELRDDSRTVLEEMQGASWGRRDGNGNGHGHAAEAAYETVTLDEVPKPAAGAEPGLRGVGIDDIRAAAKDSVRALMLIRAYRVRGHLEADLDPLNIKPRDRHPELDPATYGFTEADMDRPIFLDGVLGFQYASLRQIVQIVRDTYCGKIGVEYMHIQDPAQKAWIQERIESIRNQPQFTEKGKRAILERLTSALTSAT